MNRQPQSSDASARAAHINVDFNALREVAYLGVRRAAAFLSIGLATTEDYVPISFAIEKHSSWRFLREPVPESLAKDAVKEFRSWLIGNALRELDLHFSLFLDQISWYVRLSKLHGKRVRTTHIIKTISGETNAAKKYDTVMRELGELEPDTSMLRSLSNARNCLAHSNGVVGPRHANADGSLEIRWLGLQARLTEGEKQTILPPVFEPIYVPGGGTIELVVTERERYFSIGEKIDLTPYDLHEICFYYLQLTDQVTTKFAADLASRGIGAAEASSATVPPE